MKSDLESLLREAALDAPLPSLPTKEFRAKVRQGRMRNAIGLTTAFALVIAGVFIGVSHGHRSVNVVARDCGGEWIVSTPPLGRVQLEGGLINGEDRWIYGREGFDPTKGTTFIARLENGTWVRHDLPLHDSSVRLFKGANGTAWAAGAHPSPANTLLGSLLLRWNGSSWQTERVPPVQQDFMRSYSSKDYRVWPSVDAVAEKDSTLAVAESYSVAHWQQNEWFQVRVQSFLFARNQGQEWRSIPLPDLRGSYTVEKILGSHGSFTLQTHGTQSAAYAMIQQRNGGWITISPGGKPVIQMDLSAPNHIWGTRPFVADPTAGPGAPIHGMINIVHFNGTSWTEQSVAEQSVVLTDGVKASSVYAWITGRKYAASTASARRSDRFSHGPSQVPIESVMLRWNGTSLSEETLNLPKGVNSFNLADIEPNGQGLAVGSSLAQPLILTRC